MPARRLLPGHRVPSPVSAARAPRPEPVKQAANAGSGQAAKRLYDIIGKGEGGVARDYGEALKWAAKARSLGVEVQGIEKKD